MKKINKLNTGFTLVETLVAISIFSISILGMMSVLGSGIANTNYAKRKIVATYLAQEGIEYIRNMRDTAVLYTSNGWTSNFKAKAKIASCKNDTDQACGIDNSLLYNVFQCNSSSNFCKLFIDNGNYNSNNLGTDSGFVRKFWAEEITPNKEIKIYSKVEWKQGSGDYNITFSENLFNWYEI